MTPTADSFSYAASRTTSPPPRHHLLRVAAPAAHPADFPEGMDILYGVARLSAWSSRKSRR